MDPIRDRDSFKDTYLYSLNAGVKTNPFGQNISAEQAYKRTERILSALYLITNYVPETEPLRLQIRTEGNALLSLTLALREGFRVAGSRHSNRIMAQIRELISLLQMLAVGGYASRQNIEILIQALDQLGQFIESASRSSLAEDIVLKREDFVPAQPELEAGKGESEGQSERQSGRPSRTSGSPRTREPRAHAPAHTERRSSILDILRRGDSFSIRDISSQIVGVSEKTIQRELNGLIDEGLVEKQGIKRWSRYSLVR